MNAVAHQAYQLFPGDAASIKRARQWTADTLMDTTPQLPAQVISDVILIVSELATNAIRHTASDSGTYTVTLETDRAQVRVWVMDQGGAATLPIARTPGRMDVSGRGLAIVEAFSDTCGPILTTEATGYMATIDLTEPSP
ncbi:anti-sigma regulatory factor (Ser/Thr protein kinase) [Murinocardiopsis flavida]|uniref:Anti-sigma regulatory factor (Ser/Thr protein kinase) n=1 Tax=Murinocardiopsis flavida TaxID=645275 RepID=A0A2P8C7B4_9ACTN|nr:ATP-binding protein [Murinocardiopsis flavida]PSK80859.1 anti-sigma regulatory factor (Ser/Thr protein kinase) [Murinocardiopsis flavida]